MPVPLCKLGVTVSQVPDKPQAIVILSVVIESDRLCLSEGGHDSTERTGTPHYSDTDMLTSFKYWNARIACVYRFEAGRQSAGGATGYKWLGGAIILAPDIHMDGDDRDRYSAFTPTKRRAFRPLDIQ